MFCYQECRRQQKGHRMYYERGFALKLPETAGLQDLLVCVTKGLSAVTTQAKS